MKDIVLGAIVTVLVLAFVLAIVMMVREEVDAKACRDAGYPDTAGAFRQGRYCVRVEDGDTVMVPVEEVRDVGPAR